jgi:lipopolysaccharide/colanic/teichoic acid biosynthesis glycosyltransferase
MLLKPIELNYNKQTGVAGLRNWEHKFLLVFVDIMILLVMLFTYHRTGDSKLGFNTFILKDSLSIIYSLFLYGTLSIIFNLYDLDYVSKTRKVLPLSFFIGITCTTFYVFAPVISPSLPTQRIPILTFIFGFTTSLVIWRVFYASVIHKNVFAKNYILLTAGTTDVKYLQSIKTSLEGNDYGNGLRLLRIYSIPDGEKEKRNLSRALERMASKKLIDNIVILDKDQEAISKMMNPVFVKILKYGVHVRTYFGLYEEIKEAIPLRFIGTHFYTILPVSRYNSNYIYLLWHRILDIIAAVIGISLMIILTPVILLLNVFFNRGPLFYNQYRVGKGGEEIEITKFRSMIVEAEKDGAKMSVKGDLRITSFGHILRKTRVDELPQFWSVLKGQMSLIGPRPERKVFIEQLVKSIPLYDSRHLIRPGITGWAQVKYDYGENIEDSLKKLEYDLYYIKNRSVTLDIRIIFKTINTVIFYKGQ